MDFEEKPQTASIVKGASVKPEGLVEKIVEKIEEKLKKLPASPGVYIMKGGSGEILYMARPRT